jgi:hypothetical protein
MRVASLSWLFIVTTVRTNGTIASMKQERDSRKAHGGYLRPFSLLPTHSRRRAPQHWRTAVELFVSFPPRPSLRHFWQASLRKEPKWT